MKYLTKIIVIFSLWFSISVNAQQITGLALVDNALQGDLLVGLPLAGSLVGGDILASGIFSSVPVVGDVLNQIAPIYNDALIQALAIPSDLITGIAGDESPLLIAPLLGQGVAEFGKALNIIPLADISPKLDTILIVPLTLFDVGLVEGNIPVFGDIIQSLPVDGVLVSPL